MSKNDVTGDEIKTKSPSDAYRDNYDKIFRKHGKAMTPKEFAAKRIMESKLLGNSGAASKTAGT